MSYFSDNSTELVDIEIKKIYTTQALDILNVFFF